MSYKNMLSTTGSRSLEKSISVRTLPPLKFDSADDANRTIPKAKEAEDVVESQEGRKKKKDNEPKRKREGLERERGERGERREKRGGGGGLKEGEGEQKEGEGEQKEGEGEGKKERKLPPLLLTQINSSIELKKASGGTQKRVRKIELEASPLLLLQASSSSSSSSTSPELDDGRVTRTRRGGSLVGKEQGPPGLLKASPSNSQPHLGSPSPDRGTPSLNINRNQTTPSPQSITTPPEMRRTRRESKCDEKESKRKMSAVALLADFGRSFEKDDKKEDFDSLLAKKIPVLSPGGFDDGKRVEEKKASEKDGKSIIKNFRTMKRRKSVGISAEAIYMTIVHGGKADVLRIFKKDPKVISRVVDASGNLPIHIAAESGRTELVSLFIKHFKSPLDQTNYAGYSPLHLSLMKPDLDTALLLVEHGANVMMKTPSKSLPLHLLSSVPCDDPIIFYKLSTLMVSKGAQVNEPDRQGNTCLHLAAYFNNTQALLFFSNMGANFDSVNREQKTPLMEAVEQSSTSSALLLIDLGASLDQIRLDKLENVPREITAALQKRKSESQHSDEAQNEKVIFVNAVVKQAIQSIRDQVNSDLKQVMRSHQQKSTISTSNFSLPQHKLPIFPMPRNTSPPNYKPPPNPNLSLSPPGSTIKTSLMGGTLRQKKHKKAQRSVELGSDDLTFSPPLGGSSEFLQHPEPRNFFLDPDDEPLRSLGSCEHLHEPPLSSCSFATVDDVSLLGNYCPLRVPLGRDLEKRVRECEGALKSKIPSEERLNSQSFLLGLINLYGCPVSYQMGRYLAHEMCESQETNFHDLISALCILGDDQQEPDFDSLDSTVVQISRQRSEESHQKIFLQTFPGVPLSDLSFFLFSERWERKKRQMLSEKVDTSKEENMQAKKREEMSLFADSVDDFLPYYQAVQALVPIQQDFKRSGASKKDLVHLQEIHRLLESVQGMVADRIQELE